MKISPARVSAYEILFKIEREQAFSAVLLPQYEEKLNRPDRALTHELTLGILRRKLYLDRVIELLSGKKVGKLDVEVLLALRIGLYQILFLDKIPVSAAVNESVNLVQHARKTSAKGFVNAVLRKAAREKTDPAENIDDRLEKLSVETSHPVWLIEKWITDFGFEETARLAQINNQTPRMVFRLTAKSDDKTIEILKKVGLEMVESELVEGAWVVSKPNETLHSFAETGKVYFQEEASQMVAGLVNLQPGESFWDVCAAPGSKTTYVARQKAKSKEQNRLVAGDVYEHRLKILRENCLKQGADFVEIVSYDAEKEVPFADQTFDWILVDAPCSGTGTIRHNPEIRYSLNDKDFEELADKQLGILKNASKALKIGGRLIYSTCSLEREENEEVIAKFVALNPNFQKVLPDLPRRFLTEDGFARTFVPRDKTDGFFIAMLKRC